MSTDELLILDAGHLSERIDTLFKRLDDSASLRELFVRDTAGVISNMVLAEFPRLTPGQINQANRLLYSLLSNQRFMKWSEDFQEAIAREIDQEVEKIIRTAPTVDRTEAVRIVSLRRDRATMYKKISKAAVKFLDVETIYSLLVADRGTEPHESGWPRAPHAAHIPLIGESYDSLTVTETLVFVEFAIAIQHLFTRTIGTLALATEKVSRADLDRIANQLAGDIAARGDRLRRDGKLTSLEATRMGNTL